MGRPIPPLAVGMPVFNGEQYVAEAIESILGQTYSEFEFYISDNASTDATEEICRSFAAVDERIKYSRLSRNLGAAANFNAVFEQSESLYFKFAAYDDVCEPNFIETCMSTFDDAPDNVGLCYPGTIRIDSNGTRQGILPDRLDLREQAPHQRFRSFLAGYNLSNCFYGVLRSSIYRSTRMHQTYIAADIVLLGELALRGQIWQLPEPLFLRRFHSGMSGEAAETLEDLVVQHYDTSHAGEPVLYRTRMLREFLRAITLAPLTASQARRCRLALLTSWLPRRSPSIAHELARHAFVSARQLARR